MQIYRPAGLASGSVHGFMVQVCYRLMSQLLKRQIERLEVAIERSSDWLEIQYLKACLLYTSPSPRDRQKSRMPSSA